LIEHIGTNLVAPAHISFGDFQLLLFRHARAQLHLVEARLQHLHGFRTVTVLGTVVLTLHHNARRKVGDTHGGVGFVNVLTARTTGTVRVDAQVCRVDFHLNRIVDLGVDEYTGKRGVAAVRRIEGALAHQAVYTCFGTKVSVSVFPRHLDGGRLDARYFAFGFFQNFSLEILVLAVAQVLAQQHGRPILSFSAPGAGLYVDKAIVRIGRVGEHASELQLLELGADCIDVGFDRLQRGVVIVFLCQLEQIACVAQALSNLTQRMNDIFQAFLFTAKILRVLGIVPDVGVFQFGIDYLQTLGFGVVVKDTSVRRIGALRNLRYGRQSGSDVRLPWYFRKSSTFYCSAVKSMAGCEAARRKREIKEARPRACSSWLRVACAANCTWETVSPVSAFSSATAVVTRATS